MSVEIKNYRNEYTKEQCAQIEELCLEEELVRILEAGQSCDVNLIIALILSRQLGWPIDFIHDDSTCTFVLVVPPSPFGGANMAPALGTSDGLMGEQAQASHPALRKPAAISFDQMHKDAADVRQQADIVPTQDGPVKPLGDHPECLLVSCSDLVPLFE